MGDFAVGQCVTFLDGSMPNHVGLILEVKEIMTLLTAEVLWDDGAITICDVTSLRIL